MNKFDITGWADLVPFVSLSAAKAGEHAQRPLVTRIMEGVIMGLAGGALGTYITVQVMVNDIQWIRTTVATEIAGIKAELANTRTDIRRIEDRQFEIRK